MEDQFDSDIFIDALLKKSHPHFNLVMCAYNDFLSRVAMKRGFYGSDKDELIQSVWVSFYEKIHNFKRESKVKTYLTGILINKMRELKRDRDRHSNVEPYDLEKVYSQHDKFHQDPQKKLSEKETMLIIANGLKNLPKNQKEAFDMKILQDLSTDHICKQVNITASHLGVLIYRAKKNIGKSIVYS